MEEDVATIIPITITTFDDEFPVVLRKIIESIDDIDEAPATFQNYI